jgi:hypothetical protein
VIEWGHVDPDDLDHWFREAAEKRLGPLPELWLVTDGYRSLEEQGALYAKYKAGNPKASPPGLSPTTTGSRLNIALDVDGKIGGAVSWDTHEYAEQGGRFWAAIDASPELHSGRWFKDADHIEAVHWQRRVGRTP